MNPDPHTGSVTLIASGPEPRRGALSNPPFPWKWGGFLKTSDFLRGLDSPMNPNAPAVTVLVTAYDRREFLDRAVQTALEQSVPRSSYEVVVLSNFTTPLIEQRRDRGEIVWEFDDSPRLGATLLHGTELSQGDWLIFLDDDDAFRPQKIGRFWERIRAHPGAWYYHNSFTFFRRTSDLEPLVGPSLRPPGTVQVMDWSDPGRMLRFLASRNRETNLSSTAVRRELVERARPSLTRLRGLSDTFFLFAALAVGRPLIFDHDDLTCVRRHSRNTSTRGSDVRRREEAWELIADLLRETSPRPELNVYLEIRRARAILAHSLLGPRKDSGELRKALRTVIRYTPISGAPLSLQYLAIAAWEMLRVPTSDRLRALAVR